MSAENKDFRDHDRFCKADRVILCYNVFPSVLRSDQEQDFRWKFAGYPDKKYEEGENLLQISKS